MLEVARDGHRGTLAFLPTFHVIGFTNNFLANLAAGVRCCVYRDAPHMPLTPRLLLRACDELRPTLLDTVRARCLAAPSPSPRPTTRAQAVTLAPVQPSAGARPPRGAAATGPRRGRTAAPLRRGALRWQCAQRHRRCRLPRAGSECPRSHSANLRSTRLQPHASRLQPHACR